MNILQVTNYFKPSWEAGGPVRATYEISKSLVQAGHNVTVYTTDGFKQKLDVKKNEPIFVDGIRTYYFKNLSPYLSRNMNLPIPYYSPITLKREMMNYDIIHIHEYRTFLAVLVHYYANKYNVPYVLQPRGSMPLMGKTIIKKTFDYLFGKCLIRDASAIISSSKIESSFYSEIFPMIESKKIYHIPNGIDLEPSFNLAIRGNFRKHYLIDEKEKIILFIGRIHEIKGLNMLIEVFKKLIEVHKNIKLFIVGPDDGYLAVLETTIDQLFLKDYVIVAGPLYGQKKSEAYMDADVFVLPSMYESFGNVVLEAIAHGTPVVVTNRCGVSDIIQNDVGLVVEYDKSQLFNALDIMLSDKFKGKLRKEDVKMIIDSLSWNQIRQTLENVYSEILV